MAEEATPPAELRGELRDHLIDALQRVPGLAGRELTLTPLSGGITNRNFLVTVGGLSDRYVIRLAGNGLRCRRRRRSGGDRIHPA